MGMCDPRTIIGMIGIVLIVIANMFMIGRCIALYRYMDARMARRVMFGSYMYLPVVLLALLMSKA
jgi:protoheme IX farnesyltransferase